MNNGMTIIGGANYAGFCSDSHIYQVIADSTSAVLTVDRAILSVCIIRVFH